MALRTTVANFITKLKANETLMQISVYITKVVTVKHLLAFNTTPSEFMRSKKKVSIIRETLI